MRYINIYYNYSINIIFIPILYNFVISILNYIHISMIMYYMVFHTFLFKIYFDKLYLNNIIPYEYKYLNLITIMLYI